MAKKQLKNQLRKIKTKEAMAKRKQFTAIDTLIMEVEGKKVQYHNAEYLYEDDNYFLNEM